MRAPTTEELLVAQDRAQDIAGEEVLVLTRDELGLLLEEQFWLGRLNPDGDLTKGRMRRFELGRLLVPTRARLGLK